MGCWFLDTSCCWLVDSQTHGNRFNVYLRWCMQSKISHVFLCGSFWKPRYLQIYIHMFVKQCVGKPSIIVHKTATPYIYIYMYIYTCMYIIYIGHWNHRLPHWMTCRLTWAWPGTLYLGWRMAHLSCFTIGWCEVPTLIWYPVNMADCGEFKCRVLWG